MSKILRISYKVFILTFIQLDKYYTIIIKGELQSKTSRWTYNQNK